MTRILIMLLWCLINLLSLKEGKIYLNKICVDVEGLKHAQISLCIRAYKPHFKNQKYVDFLLFAYNKLLGTSHFLITH